MHRFVIGLVCTCLLSIILTFSSEPVSASGEARIIKEKLPSWVVEYAIPKPNADSVRFASDGVYDLLQDTQIRIGFGNEETFRRTAQRVTNRSGLEEAARLQLEFSPDTDELVLHRAAIWREGKRIEQTEGVKAEILRRESELEKDIITNDRTADIRLQDVRVGDIVDFAWTWRTRKTYWPSQHFSTHMFGWSVPVAQVSVRLVKPQALDIFSKSLGDLPKPFRSISGDASVLTWMQKDSKAIPAEDDTPDWLEPWPKLEISTMESWSEVVAWALPFYDVSDQLPDDLAVRVEKIGLKSSDPMMRITEALHLVQDNIRYTSIPLVSGGYAPRSPTQTWSSGYGDCKDKTALLIAVLKRLDITAVPALTDTQVGPGLSNMQPSANIFDHVIVRVDGLKKPLWLDPTGSHEGGIAPDIADQAYGAALPLRQGQRKLEPIEAPTPIRPTVDVTETHTLGAKGVTVDVRRIYLDDEADIMRNQIAKNSVDDLDRDDLEYYGGIYPNIEQVGETVFKDDRIANRLVVAQQYLLSKSVDGYGDTIVSYQANAWPLTELFPEVAAGKRIAPIEMPRQINRRFTMRISTPTRIGLPTNEKIVGDAFDFERKGRREAGFAIIEFTLKGKARSISAADTNEYRSDARRLDDLRYAFIDLTDEFGGYAILFLIALAFYIVGGFVLLFERIRHVKAQEASGNAAGTLYPVGLLKFGLLGVATSGVYPAYWFWRCWRQLWHKEGRQILPFWRAVFGQFWTYALFETARDRAEKKWPKWVGAIVMVAYLILGVAATFDDRLKLPTVVSGAIALLTPLVLVPLVRQVNSANTNALIEADSTLERRHWLLLICGTPFAVALLLIG